MSQTLTETLQANTRYALNVGIGNIASGTATNGTFFDLDGFPGYRVDLSAGGTVIAQDNNSQAGLIAEGAFGNSTVTFASGAAPAQLGQPLQIRLVNLNQVDAMFPNANLEVDFDNVRLTATAVPEPCRIAWLGMTTVVFFRFRKEFGRGKGSGGLVSHD